MSKKPSRRVQGKKPKRRASRKSEAGEGLDFDHLFLATRDFERTWKFWTRVVGLEGVSRWGSPEYAGSIALGDGSIVIAQGEEGFYDELGYTSEVGKPQLYVRTRDVDALHRKMVSRGANIVRSPLTTHFGLRCFSVEGPDGMVVVFVQSK